MNSGCALAFGCRSGLAGTGVSWHQASIITIIDLLFMALKLMGLEDAHKQSLSQVIDPAEFPRRREI